MRKNTLIKLLAVLALCVLTCVAFAACTEEEAPETAKIVVGASVNDDGDLVLAYNDGTKSEPIPLPEASDDTCDHRQYAENKYVIKHHTATEAEVSIWVCNACGASELLSTEFNHKWVDVPELEQKATCQVDGYKIQECEDCGAPSDEIPTDKKYDHKYSETAKYVGADENSNVCVNGGEYRYYCIYDCGEYEKTDVAATPAEGIDKEHTVTNWTVKTEPTATTKGLAEGVCDTLCCGATVTYELPECVVDGNPNTTDYNYTADPVTSCLEDQTGTFVLKAAAIEIKDVVVVEAGTTHMLYNAKGELEFIHRNTDKDENNKTYCYLASAYFADEACTKPGILEIADTKIESCDTNPGTPAYYFCANPDCTEEAPILIYANADHTPDEDASAAASYDSTCDKEGLTVEICKFCGDRKETDVEKKPHEKKYNTALVETADGKYTSAVTCENCTFTETYTVPAADLDTENKKATCTEDGGLHVTAKLPDGGTGTYAETENRLGHFFHEKSVNAATSEGTDPTTGETVYKYYEGCDIYDENNKLASGEAERVLFLCDECNQMVSIWVTKGDDHNALFPSDPENNND